MKKRDSSLKLLLGEGCTEHRPTIGGRPPHYAPWLYGAASRVAGNRVDIDIVWSAIEVDHVA